MLSSIEVIFHWGYLSLMLSSIEVVFHRCRLPLRLPSIEVIFNEGHLTNIYYVHIAQLSSFVTFPDGWVGRIKNTSKLSQSWSWSLGLAWAEIGNSFVPCTCISLCEQTLCRIYYIYISANIDHRIKVLFTKLVKTQFPIQWNNSFIACTLYRYYMCILFLLSSPNIICVPQGTLIVVIICF